MPEFTEREAFEEELAALMAGELQQELGIIMADIEALAELEQYEINQRMWVEAQDRTANALIPVLAAIFALRAEQTLATGDFGIELVTLTDQAALWAADYSFELVSGINATSQAALQAEVSRALELGLGNRELRNRLMGTFGPMRAEAIAVTETTRAAIEGQLAWASELQRMGISTTRRWLTAGDARVCWRCAPLDGQERGPDGYVHPQGMVFDAPPAHTRCRCDELIEPL